MACVPRCLQEHDVPFPHVTACAAELRLGERRLGDRGQVDHGALSDHVLQGELVDGGTVRQDVTGRVHVSETVYAPPGP